MLILMLCLGFQGGQEHGVPIVIAEIKDGALASQSGAFVVGDAILSVNDIDLRGAKHSDATSALSQLV